jgi:hypothetical protein
MSWFTLLGLLAMVASYLWRTRRIKPISIPPSPDRPPSPLTSVPPAEARRLVDAFAEGGGRLTVTLANGKSVIPAGLGPLTQEFFETYDSVESNDCGFEFDVNEIRPSVYINGFISIGHYEDWDVVQRPGRDDVFVVEGSETTETEMEWFPTVYHFVVHEIRECEGSSDQRPP